MPHTRISFLPKRGKRMDMEGKDTGPPTRGSWAEKRHHGGQVCPPAGWAPPFAGVGPIRLFCIRRTACHRCAATASQKQRRFFSSSYEAMGKRRRAELGAATTAASPAVAPPSEVVAVDPVLSAPVHSEKAVRRVTSNEIHGTRGKHPWPLQPPPPAPAFHAPLLSPPNTPVRSVQ